jgi:hypothetical protein
LAIDPAVLAWEDIVPEEVRRLHLDVGDTLIVRVSDLTPWQMASYQEHLEAWFPNNPVRVLHADEILVASSAEDNDDAGD